MDPQKLIDNFSTHLKNTIARAISLAAYMSHREVEPIHLFVSLASEDGSIAAEIMQKISITKQWLTEHLELDAESLRSINTSTNLPELSEASRDVLEQALLLAYDRGHSYIGTEHLLYGLVHAKDVSIRDILAKKKVTRKLVDQYIETILDNTNHFSALEDGGEFDALPEPIPADQEPTLASFLPKRGKKQAVSALQHFTVNLTDKYIQEDVDPVIGREHEIERIINTLSRRRKNNPILIGEPGVGKTAIVEGLAKRICEGAVPDVLKRKKILAIDLALLISGTIYRGEFESRLKQVIDELSKRSDCILFIDELHNIIGAGSNQGTLDAANILKPALARGQLRCIGATTLDEYTKYIAGDPALQRRFEPITVEEPGREETEQILAGLKKQYEQFHRVTITKTALESAIELSNKYIHHQYQPDKAIDLLDEAASAIRARQKASPTGRKLDQLYAERDAYQTRKQEAIDNEQLETALKWKQKSERLEKRIAALEKTLAKENAGKRLQVTKKHVAEALSARLRIDLARVLESEWDTLAELAKNLKTAIVGQDTAIAEIAATLEQRYVSGSEHTRPFASFLFTGPSGVGKTATAKALAAALYHDEKALIKLDMSEFAEPHSVSKILGAPAGYVGYKERNRFLEHVRKQPYSVILLDEIDKAHPDVIKLLLQILDEGSIVDSGGKTTHFKQAIVILTSNIGAELFTSAGIGFGDKSTPQLRRRAELTTRLKEELSSAVLSRLDRTIVFEPLSETHLNTIVTNHIANLSKRLAQQYRISLSADRTALASIVAGAETRDFGARHLGNRVDSIVHSLMVAVLKQNKRTERSRTRELKLIHETNEFRLVEP